MKLFSGNIFPALIAVILLSFVNLSSQRILSPSQPKRQSECNTAPADPQGDHYLIGYGSLLNTASKERTDNTTGPNIPVEIQGFSRVWNARSAGPSFGTTFLGIVANDNGSLNGAIFKLSSSDSLPEFDYREENYCREEVDPAQITLLQSDSEELPSGQYWIYVTMSDRSIPPSTDYPIVQSYVDVFISGCLELETKYELEGFAQNCVKTTVEWKHPWVNDRIYPRRPFLYEPRASQIDRLLSELVPEAYQGIRIE